MCCGSSGLNTTDPSKPSPGQVPSLYQTQTYFCCLDLALNSLLPLGLRASLPESSSASLNCINNPLPFFFVVAIQSLHS